MPGRDGAQQFAGLDAAFASQIVGRGHDRRLAVGHADDHHDAGFALRQLAAYVHRQLTCLGATRAVRTVGDDLDRT